jgi:apolipoprotein N-acyltransferase
MLSRTTKYALAALSAVLVLLSYPPLDLGFLAWIGFVPWLVVLYHEANPKNVGRLRRVRGVILTPIAAWIGFLIGDYLGMFAPASWYPTVVALYWPIAALGVLLIAGSGFMSEFPEMMGWRSKEAPPEQMEHLSMRLPGAFQIFIPAVLWTATEFLMLNVPIVYRFMGAMGFFSIAKTQWQYQPLLRLASFTGMYGITFLVVLVNCAIAYGIVHYRETRRVSWPAVAVLVAFVVLLGALSAGKTEDVPGTVRVAIIHAPPQEGENLSGRYAELTIEAIETYEPDLVLWATWGFGARYGLTGPDPDRPSLLGPQVNEHADLAPDYGLYLAGAGPLIRPDGSRDTFPVRYHFMSLPDALFPPDVDLQAALFPEAPVYGTNLGRMGMLFCLEGGFPLPTSQLVRDGVDFVVITTGQVSEHFMMPWQFVTNAVYRAAEQGIPVVHVMNYEESVVIDPRGRIVNEVSTEEIAFGRLAFSEEETFYAAHGDLFAYAVVGIAALMVAGNVYLKRRSPFVYCRECRAEVPKGAEKCPSCGGPAKKPPFWKRWGSSRRGSEEGS